MSKSSPLCIDLSKDREVCADFEDWKSATELIGQQSHRLRELCYVSQSKPLRMLGKTLSPPLPLLESLVLRHWGSPYRFISWPLCLLSATGHTPRLRYLELHHFPVAWTDPMFYSMLTMLAVITKAHQNVWLFTGTFEQFLDALQATAPSLVHLTLEESMPQL